MSSQCFKFLLRFLPLDDPTDRERRKRHDRLAACRDIFEERNDNCGLSLHAGEFVIIDE